jgi:hypothetical protein
MAQEMLLYQCDGVIVYQKEMHINQFSYKNNEEIVRTNTQDMVGISLTDLFLMSGTTVPNSGCDVTAKLLYDNRITSRRVYAQMMTLDLEGDYNLEVGDSAPPVAIAVSDDHNDSVEYIYSTLCAFARVQVGKINFVMVIICHATCHLHCIYNANDMLHDIVYALYDMSLYKQLYVK